MRSRLVAISTVIITIISVYISGCSSMLSMSDKKVKRTYKIVPFTPGKTEKAHESFSTPGISVTQARSAAPITFFTEFPPESARSENPSSPPPDTQYSEEPQPEDTYILPTPWRTDDPNEYGCRPENINSGGSIAQKGEWLYFSNPKDNDYLWKSKVDGSAAFRLTEDAARSINVVGDWVYFVNVSNFNYICKISTDGKQKCLVDKNGANQIYVIGHWIYYSDIDYGLYKVRTNGTEHTFLLNNWYTHNYVRNLNFAGDTLYYMQIDRVDKMKTDGTGVETVSEHLRDTQNYSISGDWIYFTKYFGTFSFYKINLDGSQFGEIYHESTGVSYDDLQASGDWLYFHGSDGLIYKMSTDGSGKEPLTSVKTAIEPSLSLSDGWLYFFDAEGYLCKIRTDGTGFKRI